MKHWLHRWQYYNSPNKALLIRKCKVCGIAHMTSVFEGYSFGGAKNDESYSHDFLQVWGKELVK